MSTLLFVVHGMGSNPPGWSQGIRDKLDEVAGRYATFKNGPSFSQRAQIIEIRYDDVFEQYVEQWQAEADALGEWSTKQGTPLPKVVGWLKKTLPTDSSAKNFFWSTALDPILYRAFPIVRDQVRAVVMSQFVSALTEGMAGGAVPASVLAHSLGTAVVHDTLAQLGGKPFQDNESFTAGRFAFANLFMLADVCRLGPPALIDIDALDPEKSVVRPTSAGNASNTYCANFLNAWHRWDPFVLCAPFRPTNWGNDYYELGPLDHFHQTNIHGFTHYLDHPLVHIPIINATLGLPAIGMKEQQDAIAKYPIIAAPACMGQVDAIRAKAAEFQSVSSDIEELAIKIAEFYDLAKQAGITCKEMGFDV